MIDDLTLIENYISEEQEKELIEIINKNPYNKSLKRYTQHYGYTYNYRSRSITDDDYLGDIPDWLNNLATKILNDNYISKLPDQVIINRYLPGEGISAYHERCST